MSTPPPSEWRCWTLSTGEAGATSQALGLAEAIGLPFEHKTVYLRRPWHWLPGYCCPGVLRWGLAENSASLSPPWPELLISCGRRAGTVSVALKQASGGRIRTVHIQDPQIPPRYFDRVVPPRHDGLVGPNVIPTRGALHRVTAAKLAEYAARHAALLDHLPRPLVAVLVGGSTRNCRFTLEDATRLGEQLAALARDTGAGLAITPSRRTGEENVAALRAALAGVPHFFWDGSGENPYFGLLGLADHIVVTGDSASMVSEACSTGKPVHVIDLQGYNRRLRVFHEELRREGVTRPFDGRLAHWSYQPVNDTPEVAARLREWLGLSGP